MSEFRKRVLVPAALPIVAGGFIAILAVAFSRVLLAVPEAGSTILAMLLAAMILAVCGVIAAAGKGFKQSQKILTIFGALALLGAGVGGAALGVREIAVHGEEVPIAAENLMFEPASIAFAPGIEVTIAFENRDDVPHDIDIFTDDSFTPPPLFDSTPFTGPATQALSVPPLEAGTYAFRCSIHPQMTGEVLVEEGAGGEHSGGEGSEGTAEH